MSLEEHMTNTEFILHAENMKVIDFILDDPESSTKDIVEAAIAGFAQRGETWISTPNGCYPKDVPLARMTRGQLNIYARSIGVDITADLNRKKLMQLIAKKLGVQMP